MPTRAVSIVAGDCRLPAFVLEPQTRSPAGSVVVLHALAANRRLMRPLGTWLAATGFRVYLLDLPGHGENAEPFTVPRAVECAAAAVEWLDQRGEIALDQTVLVGHSLGGAIAIKLADHFPCAATVAISPAPMVAVRGLPSEVIPVGTPRRMPVNLLILRAQFDFWLFRRAAQELLVKAGGERFESDDFRQKRAVRLKDVSWALHTGLLFDPRVAAEIRAWAAQAMTDSHFARAIPRGQTDAVGMSSLLPLPLGILGLCLMFPFVADSICALSRASGSERPARPPAPGRVLAHWSVAALLAVGVLKLWPIWKPSFRASTGGYLASFLLIAGILLIGLVRGPEPFVSLRVLAAGSLLGLVTILMYGAWLNWQVTEAWLNPERWRWFPLWFLMTWLYFFAEETALGEPGKGRNARRFGMFLLLRLVLWLARLIALFLLNSGQVLLFLLGMYFAAFSVAQRLGGDAVRRRTGSPSAAAVFDALLAAWFIAAVFPLT